MWRPNRRHLLVLGLFAGSAQGAGFVDPLQRPAIPSRIAAGSLMLGITRAGQRLVAVGQRGHIVTSDDAGSTWRQSVVPVGSDLTALAFPTPELGWAVGHDGVILHTRDGGLTWQLQMEGRQLARMTVETLERGTGGSGSTDPRQHARLLEEAHRHVKAAPDWPFLDVWFADAQRGFAVGAFNNIVHTVDGGANWVSWFARTDNPGSLHLNAVRGHGTDVYVAGERGLVLRLDTRVDRFVPVPTGYGGSYFALMVQPQAVLALGMRGHMHRSTDQGASWTRVAIEAQAGMTGAALLDNGEVVAVSQAGQVWTSRDHGASFELRRTVATMAVAGVCAADAGHIALVGTKGIRLQTLD